MKTFVLYYKDYKNEHFVLATDIDDAIARWFAKNPGADMRYVIKVMELPQ